MAEALNITAICGSLRKGSFNRLLMNTSIGLAGAGLKITEAPSFAAIPHYNFDEQEKGFPKEAEAWADAIRSADGVLIVSPEYNWSIPGALKNAIDWVSRLKEQPFKGKPVAIQSAAGGLLGGIRMQQQLRMSLTGIDAIDFGRPEVLITFAAKKFVDGKLADEEAVGMIKQQLAGFEAFVRKFAGK